MRLTRVGWNNVIIYGVMVLFILLYIVPQELAKHSNAPATRLIEPHQQFLSYQFPQATLTQVAGQWQFQPSQALSVDAIMFAWQRLPLQALSVAPDLVARVCQVELVISAQPEPLQVILSTGAEGDYLQQAEHWFQLQPGQLDQLCPPSLR